MDDYSVSSLQESRNEWCARLINILTPLVIEGFKSIFDESWKLCQENDEQEKYLMTFQNFLARIPKWNPSIIEEETKRITEKSNCGYLTDLISCVHIIQLKSLTCMRVGNKQKKIDINVPSFPDFIHKVYINTARKIYTNIYLFEKNLGPLQIQKHNRELELIVKEQILNSIRDNIPVENILKVYLDETIEEDVLVEESEEIISTEPIEENENEQEQDQKEPDQKEQEQEQEQEQEVKNIPNIDSSDDLIIEPLETNSVTTYSDNIQFNDIDESISIDNRVENIMAPKTNERLQQISNVRNEARKIEEASHDNEDDEEDRIKIGERIKLTDLDVHDLERPKITNKIPIGLEEIEILT
jgi:hypothetical protein